MWFMPTPASDRPDSAKLAPGSVLDRQVKLYQLQRAIPAYQTLRDRARVLGTWDDHDFGLNDDGANFVGREEAQRNSLDFYPEPIDSPRRGRPGIYASYRFGPPGRTVQVIILDTRYFRSPLRKETRIAVGWVDGILTGRILPSDRSADTILGDAQWQWLESALREPADVRLILSSIQVVSDDHRFEKWGNFPHERRRLFTLIRDTGAQGVVFLSGDRHTGELSRLDPAREPNGEALDPGYPLYDITSSAVLRSRPTNFADTTPGGRCLNARSVTLTRSTVIGSALRWRTIISASSRWNGRRTGGPQMVISLHLDHGPEVLRHRVPLAAPAPEVTSNPIL